MRMIEYNPVGDDRMTREDFIALAWKILKHKGLTEFEDDWIAIRSNYNGLDLQVSRKAQPDAKGTDRDHLSVSNPVLMVKKGEIIRFNGEYVHVSNHMRELVAHRGRIYDQENEIVRLLRGVVGVVEANSFEKHVLWEKNSKSETPKTWECNLSGYSVCCGKDTSLSILADVIDGHKILFIYPTSVIINHEDIDQWLSDNLPFSAFRENGRYVNKVDAQNFHNVFPRKVVDHATPEQDAVDG